jgi:uncharacterized protein (UPF0335 family)
MARRGVDKSIDALEQSVKKVVNVVMAMKKEDKHWRQKRAEIEERLKSLIKRIEGLSDEEKS